MEPLLREGSDECQVSARIIDDDGLSRLGWHWFTKRCGKRLYRLESTRDSGSQLTKDRL